MSLLSSLNHLSDVEEVARMMFILSQYSIHMFASFTLCAGTHDPRTTLPRINHGEQSRSSPSFLSVLPVLDWFPRCSRTNHKASFHSGPMPLRHWVTRARFTKPLFRVSFQIGIQCLFVLRSSMLRLYSIWHSSTDPHRINLSRNLQVSVCKEIGTTHMYTYMCMCQIEGRAAARLLAR